MAYFVQLRKAGDAVHFNLGVTQQNGILKGHRWVTFAGQPVGENLLTWEQVTLFYQYPHSEQVNQPPFPSGIMEFLSYGSN